MSVNGRTCWSKTKAVGTSGTQQCGGFFKEERFRVTGCYVALSGSDANVPLEVRVWTNLDGDPGDESFAIDNVVVRQFQIGKHAGDFGSGIPAVVMALSHVSVVCSGVILLSTLHHDDGVHVGKRESDCVGSVSI